MSGGGGFFYLIGLSQDSNDITDITDETTMNNIIKTIVRQYHWSPAQIGDLFFDREDYYGIMYWHDDAVEVNREMESLMPKK
ncbi:MAG: hypothetical protein EBW87_00160 [Burkholderiaceae bacterium]|nr:hypothetical protein [Burkholderiaceae bacterium]